MRTILTPEQLQRLIAFAEDDRQTPPIEAIQALNVLHEAVQRNTVKHLEGAIKRNALLSERLEKYKEREQRKVDAGEFPGTGFTSVEVARALLYQMQKDPTMKISVGKLILTIYHMYASWLYSSKERLFSEHPTSNSFGAQLADVKAHFKESNLLYERVPYATWKAFCEKNPGVAAYVENAAAKYSRKSYDELQKDILESRPYRNASRENNNGKWGKVIEDADIYAWKKASKMKTNGNQNP